MTKAITKKAAKPKTAKAPAVMGRPTDYQDAYCDQACRLCLLGATDLELANFFGVSETTINNWKIAHPDFFESIQDGRVRADAKVAESMYKRALGYSHPDTHISNYQGDVTITPVTKHYPPDTQAASLWLRNRQPDKWRDKTTQEITGKDGAPIAITDETERASRLYHWLNLGRAGKT